MKRLWVIVACLFWLQIPSYLMAQDSPGIITTIAGGFIGDGKLATQIELYPWSVATDAKENVYIYDAFSRIRRVGSDGIITTFAGTGTEGFSGDGGPATQARLSGRDIAVDTKGNVYIVGDSRIRRVGTDGIITTIAGTGTAGFSGDGGPATLALLNIPSGIAVDTKGNIYIADTHNFRIRRIGQDGIITTIAGNGNRGFPGNNVSATQTGLDGPEGVAVDATGNVYFFGQSGRLWRVEPNGILTTFVGSFPVEGGYINSIAVDTKGVVFISLVFGSIFRVEPNGIITTFAGGATTGSVDIAVDATGSVYIADRNGAQVRRVGPDGIITIIAGGGGYLLEDGILAIHATFSSPFLGVAVDMSGNTYISDYWNHRIRRVGPDGIITTVAGSGPTGIVNGKLLGGGFSGDGGPATQANLNRPSAVTVDENKNVYIADSENSRIRRVGPDGIITTVVGIGTLGFSGDGGLAIHAQLNQPSGVAVDAKGNIYIADTFNNRIRRVGSDGIITTIVGTGEPGFSGDGGPATQANLGYPRGVVVNTIGVVYIVGTWNSTNNHRVRRVGLDGIITTIVGTGPTGIYGGGFSGDGGPATQANLNRPSGVTADAQGNVYIADTQNHRIRRVGSDGIITTIVGTGEPGFSGDGGPATQANLFLPCGVAVDRKGNVYIADSNKRIRRVSPSAQLPPTNPPPTPIQPPPVVTPPPIVTPPPVATQPPPSSGIFAVDFTVTNTAGQLNPEQGGFTVRFTLKLTNQPPLRSFKWDFGDGTTSKEPHPEHTYVAVGVYNITVAITTEAGEVITKTKEKFIVVIERPPQINFVASVLSGEAPLSVKFTAISSGGPVTGYSWNFGDNENANSTETTIDHTYRSAGTYTVVLKVSGPGGSDTKTKEGFITVTVSKPAITVSTANLSFGGVEIDENKTLVFSVSNSGRADLVVNIGRSGSNSSEFAVSPITFTVRVGQPAQTVSVIFSPVTAGNKSATLVSNHNASGNPIQVSLSGTGVLPPPPPTTTLKNPVVPNGELGAFQHGTLVQQTASGRLQLPKPISKATHTHVGVDLLASKGSPVYAFGDGVVEAVVVRGDSEFRWSGNAVMIKHETKPQAMYTIYLHMEDSPSVRRKDPVKGGIKQIGRVDSTGAAGGVFHVHFEIRYFASWLSQWNNIYGLGDKRNTSYFKENWEDPLEYINKYPTGMRLPPTPDFNGDGEVDIKDFFLFADAFGNKATGENAKFDLNGNDIVDLGDFFLFIVALKF